MHNKQRPTVTPTQQQQAAFDAATQYEIACEKAWQVARNAKPFDKAAETAAWNTYQAAISAVTKL
jgi:hypothetical protein